MYNLKPGQRYIEEKHINAWNRWLLSPTNDLPQKEKLHLQCSELASVRDQIHAWLQTTRPELHRDGNTHSDDIQEMVEQMHRFYPDPLWFWTKDQDVMRALFACNNSQSPDAFWMHFISRDNIDHYANIVAEFLPQQVRDIMHYYANANDHEDIYAQDEAYETIITIDKAEFARATHEQWQFLCTNPSIYQQCVENKEIRIKMLQAEHNLYMHIHDPKYNTEHPGKILENTLALHSVELQEDMLGDSNYKKDYEHITMHALQHMLKNPTMLEREDTVKAILNAYMHHIKMENLEQKHYHLEQRGQDWYIQTDTAFHNNKTFPLTINDEQWEQFWQEANPTNPLYATLKSLLLQEFPTPSAIIKPLQESAVPRDQDLEMLLHLHVPDLAIEHIREKIGLIKRVPYTKDMALDLNDQRY